MRNDRQRKMDKLEKLAKSGEPVLLDGAMGTYLEKLGYKGASPELANTTEPSLVERVHTEYAEAGSQIILTNTFGANRLRLSRHGQTDALATINVKGAEIAGKVRKHRPGILIAGDLGPSGGLLEPYGNISLAEARKCFLEQARILEANGVDFLLLETFADLEELKIAWEALSESVSLPVLPCFSLAPGKEHRTVMGQTLEQISAWAADRKIRILGTNCGISSSEMQEVVRGLKKLADTALWVKPNAGLPRLEGRTVTYRETAAEFTGHCLELVELGASFIGGCCGTTPEYIRSLHQALKKSSG